MVFFWVTPAAGGAVDTFSLVPVLNDSAPITRILSTISRAAAIPFKWLDEESDEPLVIWSIGVAIMKGVLSLLFGSWGC
jgi:hypothetical protein